MLNLYTDLDLISLGRTVELLIPFTGVSDYDKDPNNVIAGRFDEYYKKGKDYFSLTSIEACDACLLPIYYPDRQPTFEFVTTITPFLERVEKSGKKIIVFTGHDVQDVDVKVKNAIIFNGALNKSTQAANCYSWPHFFEDFIGKYYDGQVSVKHKAFPPSIGFCGYVPPIGIKWGKEKLVSVVKLAFNYLGLMKIFPARSSHSYRARAILGLQKSNKISTNFRIKSTFAFGPSGLNTGNTKETNDEFRRKFVENIVESDYTLCVRGIGNNSIRFFETLCCGRIPVFVNTNSVLPFDEIIDWRKLCVWVEEKDIDKIGDKVLEFHSKLSAEDFIGLQKKMRETWVEYLSPLGFFKNLKLFLNNQKH